MSVRPTLVHGSLVASGPGQGPIVLVVGSINADVIVPIDKLPLIGETIVARDEENSGKIVPGGKVNTKCHIIYSMDCHLVPCWYRAQIKLSPVDV